MTARRKTRKILFLGANPDNEVHLRVEEEFRKINEALRLVRNQGRFDLLQRLAVSPVNVHQAMLNENPQIVHLSGHGKEGGYLVWEDSNGNSKYVEPDALVELFRIFRKVRCVLLNACHTDALAKAIALHIDYVIGMRQEISDNAAIHFASAFYYALGSGKPVEDAFILGRNMVHLEDGFSETLLPVLVVNRRKYKEWSLELNASVDQAKAEAIIERLRQISLNTSITLKEIQNGGSRLIIESSKIIFEEIEMLRRIEKLVYLEGIRIEAVKMIPRLKPNLP